MSVFTLKILALTAMIIDHMGFFLRANNLVAYDIYDLMRAIGRIAFPIYCFLLVNGFDKTSNRRRYLSRLGLFAALSQIPYTLLFDYGSSFSLAQPVLSLGLAENGSFCIAVALCALVAYALLAGVDSGLVCLALFFLCGTLRLSLFGVELLGAGSLLPEPPQAVRPSAITRARVSASSLESFFISCSSIILYRFSAFNG